MKGGENYMETPVKNPFVVGHSDVYGWCVYDTRYGYSPAYIACCELLQPIVKDENGGIYETPVLLRNRIAAMTLKNKLFLSYIKNTKKGEN